MPKSFARSAEGESALVWFRRDLRRSDNAALNAAAESGRAVFCCYILDDVTPGRWRMGGASRWWLHHALAALDADLRKHGGRLILRRGDAHVEIPKLAAKLRAGAVFWSRISDPFAAAEDKRLEAALSGRGIEARSFAGALLYEPHNISTKSGGAFKVYTPFWRACLASGAARTPLPTLRKIRFGEANVQSDALMSWRLLPRAPNWAAGFPAEWRPGEAGAHAALKRFLKDRLRAYPSARDQLGVAGTSRLSPHLHFGEISPAQIAAAIDPEAPGADKFMAELGWREFSHHLLHHWPTLPEKNWKAQFDRFPWRDDDASYRAWTRGETGYPVVDAAMRELWATGYMHNRARMIAASFLIKHLLIDWRRGEAWFWDTLVDADLANNAASWQWVAGSGADASPYFRIFNPVSQGQRYDADGSYVRRWVPELAALPDKFLHAPWTAPAEVLKARGVDLGKTYPQPIVEHAAARARALSAFAQI